MNETLETQIINYFNIEDYELVALDALVYELYHGPIYLVDKDSSVFNDFEFTYQGKDYYFGDWSSEGCNGAAFGLLTEIVGNLVDRFHDIYVDDYKEFIFEKEPEGEWDFEYIKEHLDELIEKYDLDNSVTEEDIIWEFDYNDQNRFLSEPEEYYRYEQQDILECFINDRAAREVLSVL